MTSLSKGNGRRFANTHKLLAENVCYVSRSLFSLYLRSLYLSPGEDEEDGEGEDSPAVEVGSGITVLFPTRVWYPFLVPLSVSPAVWSAGWRY